MVNTEMDRVTRTAGEKGALERRLETFGELLCLVAGAWADCSTHLHQLIVTCAESKVAHLCRSTGRPELEVALFDMPNSNRFDILSISIFSEISLSISISIFSKIS